MNREELFNNIKRKKSFLCVGLDSDITKIPQHLLGLEDPVFEFNKAIIDATIPYTVAYKPNIAFYESNGVKGWISLQKTIDYLNQFKDEVFTIADGKRGDIGNTSLQYAKAFLSEDGLNFDALTVAPYMGEDSVTPFLSYEGKWVVLLALTSNKGAADFQHFQSKEGERLFEKVIKTTAKWANKDNVMFVVGATRADMLKGIRAIIPDHFLLVPGIGAQGGSLDEVAENGINDSCGLLVNASRSIIFASKEKDFAEKAKTEAIAVQQQMQGILEKYSI